MFYKKPAEETPIYFLGKTRKKIVTGKTIRNMFHVVKLLFKVQSKQKTIEEVIFKVFFRFDYLTLKVIFQLSSQIF